MFHIIKNAFLNRTRLVIPANELQIGDFYGKRQVTCVRKFEIGANQYQLDGESHWHLFGDSTLLIDRPNDLGCE